SEERRVGKECSYRWRPRHSKKKKFDQPAPGHPCPRSVDPSRLVFGNNRALILPVIFFSSTRRHTRCSRDWSSDVCSSDLAAEVFGFDAAQGHVFAVHIALEAALA